MQLCLKKVCGEALQSVTQAERKASDRTVTKQTAQTEASGAIRAGADVGVASALRHAVAVEIDVAAAGRAGGS